MTDDEDDFGDEEYDRSLGLGENDDGDGNTGIQMKNIAAKKFEEEILVDKVDTRNMSLDEDEV